MDISTPHPVSRTLNQSGLPVRVYALCDGLLKVGADFFERQLQFLLEVENVDYKRLEVGSPGIDRPLRNDRDFERFAGHVIDITLKAPLGANGGAVSASRKKFRGTLERAEGEGQWQIVWSDAPEPKPGQRVSKKREPAPLQALAFSLDEIAQARLAPIVNFKGRQAPGA